MDPYTDLVDLTLYAILPCLPLALLSRWLRSPRVGVGRTRAWLVAMALALCLFPAAAMAQAASPVSAPVEFSTPLLVFAVVAFAWATVVHFVEASSWGPKIPEADRPKLALVGGLLLGIVQAIVQGTQWKLAVVFALMTGASGMAGVSAPSTSRPPPKP